MFTEIFLPLVRDLFSGLVLYARHDWRVVERNVHRNHFLIWHFVCTYTRNSKTTGCMRTLYISKDCSTIRNVYFLHGLELDARYKWWVMPPNMHRSVLLISHLCMCTWNLRSYVDIQHIEWLLYYQRHSLCGLEFHERSDWRATAPDTHQLFSYTTLCVYIASSYIHCHLVCNYAWQQNSCTLSLPTTTHQMTALLATMHCFIRIKLAG